MRFLLLGLFLFSLNTTAQTNLTYSKARIHISSNTDLETLLSNGIAADDGLLKEKKKVQVKFYL